MAVARMSKLLTETELELMTILWEIQGGSVHDVLERLPPDRPLAYTSVSTILRILEQKGVVRSEKQGRGHCYVPVVRQDEYQARALRHVVGKVFGGEPVALVKRLVDGGLSARELESLRALLARKARR